MRLPPRITFPANDRRLVLGLAIFNAVALIAFILLLLLAIGDLQEFMDDDTDRNHVDPWILAGTVAALIVATYAGARYGVPEHGGSLPALIIRGIKAGALAGVAFVWTCFLIASAHAVAVEGNVVELLGSFVLYGLFALIFTPIFAGMGAVVGFVLGMIDIVLVRLIGAGRSNASTHKAQGRTS